MTSCIPEILSRWEATVRSGLPAQRSADRPLLADVAPVLLSQVADGLTSPEVCRTSAAGLGAREGSLPQVLQARETGFDWHLTKPLDLTELERLLSIRRENG